MLFFTVLSLSALIAAACGGGSEENTPSPSDKGIKSALIFVKSSDEYASLKPSKFRFRRE